MSLKDWKNKEQNRTIREMGFSLISLMKVRKKKSLMRLGEDEELGGCSIFRSRSYPDRAQGVTVVKI